MAVTPASLWQALKNIVTLGQASNAIMQLAVPTAAPQSRVARSSWPHWPSRKPAGRSPSRRHRARARRAPRTPRPG